MTLNDKDYTNLVFKGGGAKGCAYAGCIDVLVERGIYDNITQVGGTSAGAITAALLAAGAGNEGLTKSVKHTDFRNFVKDSWGVIGDVDRLYKGYGLHTGDGFVQILKQYFGEFSGNSDITFAQLDLLAEKQPDKFKKLTVIASNLSNSRSQLFNSKNCPNLPVWQAVRASMSIPLVFEPANINGEYYVDGGLAWNYPIDLYDAGLERSVNDGVTPKRNTQTLGFYLDSQDLMAQSDKFDDQNVKINSIGTFASGLINFMYQSANKLYIHPEDEQRTVFIDDLGISATDFSISDSLVDELITNGRKATEDYLQDNSD